MKRNNECIRAVLNYVIENTSIVAEETKFDIKPTDMYAIIKGMEDTSFNKEEIIHSIIYASRCGFLDTKPITSKVNNTYAAIDIYDVTPTGYSFLGI